MTHAENLHVGRHIAVSGEVATIVQERVHIAHERITEDEVCYVSTHMMSGQRRSLTNSSIVRSRREDANAVVAAVIIDLNIRDIDRVHGVYARPVRHGE